MGCSLEGESVRSEESQTLVTNGEHRKYSCGVSRDVCYYQKKDLNHFWKPLRRVHADNRP